MSEYHHGNLKQQLLDEGLKLLREEGIKKFSLRKLARRCNVSHTSPYRHFSNKEELILAIAREIQGRFNRALKEGLASVEGSPKEKLNAMGKSYVYFFLKNPDYLELLFLTPEIQQMVYNKHDHDESGASFMTYLSAVLSTTENTQTVFSMPVDSVSIEEIDSIPGEALKPWCLIHGLTVLLVKKALPVNSPEGIERLINQVLSQGIL